MFRRVLFRLRVNWPGNEFLYVGITALPRIAEIIICPLVAPRPLCVIGRLAWLIGRHGYRGHPADEIGVLRFNTPGKHRLTVRLIEGDPESSSLEALYLSPIN